MQLAGAGAPLRSGGTGWNNAPAQPAASSSLASAGASSAPVPADFDAAGFDAVLLEFSAAESDLPAHSAATALVMVCEGEVAAPSLLDWLGQGAADVVAALGRPPRGGPDSPRADGLHRQGAPQP